jgi:hypothetical protein
MLSGRGTFTTGCWAVGGRERTDSQLDQLTKAIDDLRRRVEAMEGSH